MLLLLQKARQAILPSLRTARASLKRQLSDQINIVTRRCAVQEQAAARWRTLRAEVAEQERRVQDLQRRLAISSPLRHSAPRSLRPPVPTIELRQVHLEQRKVDKDIAAARRVLILEAASIMGLTRGGIAGLPLPHPREMKRTSPHSPADIVRDATKINAALQHTCHFLDLLTRYLFIALPFDPGADSRRRIQLKPNLPFIRTTKYRDKNLLSLSRKNQRGFYTSYGLLAHSVAYLAWMQGVEEEDLGANLYGLVYAPGVAKSHLEIKSLGFSLDVNDVVEQVLEDCGLEEEGWALVDA